jgi:hypothetical protein
LSIDNIFFIFSPNHPIKSSCVSETVTGQGTFFNFSPALLALQGSQGRAKFFALIDLFCKKCFWKDFKGEYFLCHEQLQQILLGIDRNYDFAISCNSGNFYILCWVKFISLYLQQKDEQKTERIIG